MQDLTLSLRNIARYVRDVDGNVPLYEALGFNVVREAGKDKASADAEPSSRSAAPAKRGPPTDMTVLEHHDGLQMILHRWDERPTTMLDTSIGFSISGDAKDLRDHLEAAGWRLLRAPHETDVGYFWIYGDLDGNPINLVGKPTNAAPAPGTVRLVLRDGKAVAEPAAPSE